MTVNVWESSSEGLTTAACRHQHIHVITMHANFLQRHYNKVDYLPCRAVEDCTIHACHWSGRLKEEAMDEEEYFTRLASLASNLTSPCFTSCVHIPTKLCTVFFTYPDNKIVSWCFEPSQPQWVTSGLKTNISLSPSYSALKSSNHNILENPHKYKT